MGIPARQGGFGQCRGLEGLEDERQLQDCFAGPISQAQREQELPLCVPGLSLSCWLLP